MAIGIQTGCLQKISLVITIVDLIVVTKSFINKKFRFGLSGDSYHSANMLLMLSVFLAKFSFSGDEVVV